MTESTNPNPGEFINAITDEDRQAWQGVAQQFLTLAQAEYGKIKDQVHDCDSCRVTHTLSLGIQMLLAGLTGGENVEPLFPELDARRLVLSMADLVSAVLKETGFSHADFVKTLAHIHAETATPEEREREIGAAIARLVGNALGGGAQIVNVAPGIPGLSAPYTPEQEALMQQFMADGAKYVMVGPGGVMIPLKGDESPEDWLRSQGVDVDTDPDVRFRELPNGEQGFEVRRGSETEAKLAAIAEEQRKRIVAKGLN